MFLRKDASYDTKEDCALFYLVELENDISYLYLRSGFMFYVCVDYMVTIRQMSFEERNMVILFYLRSLSVY